MTALSGNAHLKLNSSLKLSGLEYSVSSRAPILLSDDPEVLSF